MVQRAHGDSAEDRLIGRFFRPLATDPRALALDDDVALMTPQAGLDLVLKTDAIVEHVHFLPDDPPDVIARKALRRNLSDLAGKGAMPSGYLLSIALRGDVSDDWLAGFAKGLRDDAEGFRCPLLGGETVKTPGPVTISIAMIGTVPTGSLVRRSGGRAGDRVFVTGSIGDAVVGLRVRREPALADRWGLTREERDFLVNRYLLPQPRIGLGQALRSYASAAIDVSDGLAGDLAKLCRASNVSGEIEIKRIPFSSPVRVAMGIDSALAEAVLTGGDDYEVICAVPPGRVKPFLQDAARSQVAVAEIGTLTAGGGPPIFVDATGKPMAFERLSYSHF